MCLVALGLCLVALGLCLVALGLCLLPLSVHGAHYWVLVRLGIPRGIGTHLVQPIQHYDGRQNQQHVPSTQHVGRYLARCTARLVHWGGGHVLWLTTFT